MKRFVIKRMSSVVDGQVYYCIVDQTTNRIANHPFQSGRAAAFKLYDQARDNLNYWIEHYPAK